METMETMETSVVPHSGKSPSQDERQPQDGAKNPLIRQQSREWRVLAATQTLKLYYIYGHSFQLPDSLTMQRLPAPLRR